MAALRELAQRGTLRPEHMVMDEQSGKWAKAGLVPGLFAPPAQRQKPPPPPEDDLPVLAALVEIVPQLEPIEALPVLEAVVPEPKPKARAVPAVQKKPQRAESPPPPASRKAETNKDRRPGKREALWWNCNRIASLSAGSQKGIAVLAPGIVAFLPTERTKYLLGEMALGMGKAAVGVYTISFEWLRQRPNLFHMLEDLYDERPDDFPNALREVAETLEGVVWLPDDTQYARQGKSAVIFVHNKDELRGDAPVGPMLDRLLKDWKETDPPLLGNLIGMGCVTLIPLLITCLAFIGYLTGDLPFIAVLVWMGFTAIPIIGMAILIPVTLIRRSNRRKRMAKQQDE
jgi:hypothetical protein